LEKNYIVHLLLFFLLFSPFSFFNFNFGLKIYYFNISALEFEKRERKLPEINKEKRKLVNDYFSIMKLVVFCVSKIHSLNKRDFIEVFFEHSSCLKKLDWGQKKKKSGLILCFHTLFRGFFFIIFLGDSKDVY